MDEKQLSGTIDFIYDEGSSKEDTYLIKDNIFGVFDGYDSVDQFIDDDGKTGGLIASSIARDTFSKNNKSLQELTLEANRKIKEKILASNIDMAHKSSLWGTTAAVIRKKENLIEWIQMADSLIMFIYKDNSFKLLIDDYDHDEDILNLWKELADQKKENIRGLLKEPLVELRGKANEMYGVLNGEERAISFLKSGEEDLTDVKSILLFTDGLFIPKEDPTQEEDWDTLVQLFLKGGLGKIKDFVRNLQNDDPKCWRYPRFKQHDDITAISISLN